VTGFEALARGVRLLRDAGIPEPTGDARRLLAHALGIDPGRLTLILPEPLTEAAATAYDAFLARRAKREPVSHLTGTRLFWGREFLVTADVLDPRPETEILVASALEESFSRVLDLGTGSGCLLVTLLAENRGATGQGLDLSSQALEVARANAARHGVVDRAAFAISDWFAAADDAFDLLVSNPPYIAAAEMPALEPEVRDHEPRPAPVSSSSMGPPSPRPSPPSAKRRASPRPRSGSTSMGGLAPACSAPLETRTPADHMKKIGFSLALRAPACLVARSGRAADKGAKGRRPVPPSGASPSHRQPIPIS
jgi:release factor glutamine methyltransferase